MRQRLSRPAASAAVTDHGWRYLLGSLRTSVPVTSLSEAVEVATLTTARCGQDADRHLRLDLRPDRVILTLQSADHADVTARDADLAARLTAALRDAGLRPGPEIGAEAARSVQVVELAVDAIDIAAVRPFWKAVLGYVDEPGHSGPTDPLVDPLGQSPAIWFQQMDQPRPQRNRLHLDICVPHDEALTRIEASLAAGGRLVSATRAPAFWILADAEGNEACVTTWQGRDG
ncbi:VOC family protein [Streptacidiphilus sp. MAP12-20]|uniref:VOC family protein n=1 Tax=Streptacidiphilus sp. MAP12-20 TaxID=3156299 RepID=UPI003516A3D2